MSYLYDRLSSTREGSRALSAARLRYQVLKILHRSLERSGLTQVELARRLGVRKSAVNQVFRSDGNLRVSTLAEYLHEMGSELAIEVVKVGTQRSAAVEEMDREWRASRQKVESYSSPSRLSPVELEAIDWRSASTSKLFQSFATAD
ncbi:MULTISPECIES: helix-turn-helix domain-containing protein [unclassified Solwaraspora]|uniref:helix-turn-helix domain-containing protein n=1 Tax=unclassified Solwaraspora TaxID=2627926 RepID=UPI00259BDC18|nr:helix-turn-helix domain-containing protein [Solwaraspora sp. WMMA2056]WJK41407.1 helix-turn-helix domain-containing protein [Solwaraspora sp. WMMA2056]